jgi:hypothetical protein
MSLHNADWLGKFGLWEAEGQVGRHVHKSWCGPLSTGELHLFSGQRPVNSHCRVVEAKSALRRQVVVAADLSSHVSNLRHRAEAVGKFVGYEEFEVGLITEVERFTFTKGRGPDSYVDDETNDCASDRTVEFPLPRLKMHPPNPAPARPQAVVLEEIDGDASLCKYVCSKAL